MGGKGEGRERRPSNIHIFVGNSSSNFSSHLCISFGEDEYPWQERW